MVRISKVFCFGNTEIPACVEAMTRVKDDLRNGGFEVRDQGAPEQGAPDAIVLLGGDGFLMEFLRTFRYPDVPIFGVNFGTVGFLMNSHHCVGDLPALLREGRFSEVRHPLLEASTTFVDGREETIYAFNEFVLERQTGQAVHLRVDVNDTLFNHFAGDGFVISTPAGSTAYNLAAGGPAVHPDVQGILLTPLYPHLAEPFHSVQFSLILPLGCRIAIEPEELPKRLMRLVADGRPSRSVSRVLIRDSGRRVTLLRTFDRDFTRLLSQKFIGQARS